MSEAEYITHGGDWYNKCEFYAYCDHCTSFSKVSGKCLEGKKELAFSSKYIKNQEDLKSEELRGKVECLKCKGSGKISILMGYKGDKCYDCRGNGYVTTEKRKEQEYMLDTINHIDSICPKCNGSGKYNEWEKKSNKNICYTCKGSGKVKMCGGKIIYK